VVPAFFPVVVVMVVVMVMAVMVFAVAAFVCQRWSSKQHHCYKAARHNGHYPTSQHFTSWGFLRTLRAFIRRGGLSGWLKEQISENPSLLGHS
jgi:hypothetical protein